MKSFLVNLIYLLLSLFLKYNISLSKERKETEKKNDTVVQSDILVTYIALRKTSPCLRDILGQPVFRHFSIQWSQKLTEVQ